MTDRAMCAMRTWLDGQRLPDLWKLDRRLPRGGHRWHHELHGALLATEHHAAAEEVRISG